MKRSLFSLAAVLVAAGAFGQNFTIVRPADGAHVREKVHILFPKGSIPPSGYVGIFLNGQLIDAVSPQTSGKYSEYVLDTQERGIKDTEPGKPDHLEAKLYVDYNDQPRITKTSSVDLYVGNQANIDVPNSGIKLRYNFKTGTDMIYDLEQRVVLGTISESENEKKGKPAELPLDSENIRLLYAVDNSYPGGDGLVRMQALPEKGKSYATLTTAQNGGEAKTYYDSMMASIYMKLTPTGNEVFGSIPLYFGIDGTSGQGETTSLFADFPLPTLPTKAVRPGDTWFSKFQEAKLNLNDLFDQSSVVQHFPARGEFIGVEWERGHPCAKIKNTIAISELSDEDKKLVAKGAEFGGTKVEATELIWFALDLHKVLKIDRDVTVETKSTSASAGYPGSGNGFGGPSMGGGAPSGSPFSGKGGRESDITYPMNQFGNRRGGTFQGPRMGGGRGMAPGMGAPGMSQRGMGQNGMGPGAQAQAEYIRLRTQQIFTLEL
jgi:hypothetical protein